MGHSTSSGRNAEAQRRETPEELQDRGIRTGFQELINRSETKDLNDSGVAQGSISALATAYTQTRDGSPDQTIERYVGMVGEDIARQTIATLVNRNDWDGRISNANKDWASHTPGALSRRVALDKGISTVIHTAHLDQIASAMRRRQEAREVGNNNFGNEVLRRNNRRR